MTSSMFFFLSVRFQELNLENFTQFIDKMKTFNTKMARKIRHRKNSIPEFFPEILIRKKDIPVTEHFDSFQLAN